MIGEYTHADLINNRADIGNGIFLIDTLSRDSYRHHHIPGAFNASFQKEYTADDYDAETGVLLDIETKFLRQCKKNVPTISEQKIVTYSGSEGCGLAYLAAMCLVRAGYTNVFHYTPGLRGWHEAGESFAHV